MHYKTILGWELDFDAMEATYKCGVPIEIKWDGYYIIAVDERQQRVPMFYVYEQKDLLKAYNDYIAEKELLT